MIGMAFLFNARNVLAQAALARHLFLHGISGSPLAIVSGWFLSVAGVWCRYSFGFAPRFMSKS
jgi:hypothetical protein